MNSPKIIEIPADEFHTLVDNYKKCQADREKLIKAINANNQIIDEYNKKISDNQNREQD